MSVILLGCVVIVGWLTDERWMLALSSRLPTMKVNTAFGFIAAGIALLLGQRTSVRAAIARRLVVLLIAVLFAATLGEWLLDRSFGIDEFALDDRFAANAPGRPSPQTSISFLLFSLALFALRSRTRTAQVFHSIATAAFAFAVASIDLGYLFGAHAITSTGRVTGVAILTAYGMSVLAIGTLANVADRAPLRWLWDDTASSTLMRRLLPVGVIAPPVVGYLRLQGERAGWYDSAFGVALMTGAMVVTMIVVAALTARQLDAADESRAELQDLLESMFANIPAAVAIRGLDGQFLKVNDYTAKAVGSTPENMVGRPVTAIYSGQSLDDLRRIDATVVATGESVTSDEALPLPDGTRDFHVVRFPVRGMRGHVYGIGSIGIDVTERMKAERDARRSLERFRGLLDSAPDAIVIVGSDGMIQMVNARTCELFGYSVEELVGKPVEMLVPDDVRGRHRSVRHGYAAHPEPRPMGDTVDLTARHKDGHGIPVEISLGPFATDEQVVISAAIRDVTAKRQAQIALREAEQLFRSAFDDAPIGMALTSLDGFIHQINPALAAIAGRTADSLVGMQLNELIHPADLEIFELGLSALLAGETNRLALDLSLLGENETPAPCSLQATVVRDDHDAAQRLLVQIQDVAERQHYEEQLRYMADHDPLTGLLNRRSFEHQLADHIARSRRYGADGALIALDLDQFKQVNDTLGHNIGDQLIISVAQVLRARLRDTDVLARLGGDEFAILIPKATQLEAAAVAQSIVDSVRTSAGLFEGHANPVTISAGVAMFKAATAEQLTVEEALIQADVALYDAKEAGRNRFAFYEEPDERTSRTRARLNWTTRIENALTKNRFALVAQPILDLATNDANQYELLIRMIDEEGQHVLPGAFLYVAERVGLVSRIDEWVFHQAVDLLEAKPQLKIELNLSAQSLSSDHLLDAITRRLAQSHVDPGNLIFEVTETAAVSNINRAQNFAHTLRGFGCRFALDDFGAGFGSFYYLKHLPFDYVKIDGEFVQHAMSNRMDQLVISALVRISRGLDKKTIAEFVTNESTLALVRSLGVDYAQGYGVGMPVPLSQIGVVNPDGVCSP